MLQMCGIEELLKTVEYIFDVFEACIFDFFDFVFCRLIVVSDAKK
jgi:hypothetical protein